MTKIVNTCIKKVLTWLGAAFATLAFFPYEAPAQGTAFTYQGQLQNNGSPASGTYNLTFSLFNSNVSGAPVAGPVTNNGVIISNGLFTVLVDFGPGVFIGATNWLEIAVETNGANTFTTLTPRQQITPTPYAITAGTAASAASLSIPPGMALIPAGAFTMGDNLDGGTTYLEGDSIPTNIYVSEFYMDVNLVSYSQWLSAYFWATNHGYGFVHAGAGKAVNHPVQNVDWYDCVKWCNARSQQAGKVPVYYTDAGMTAVYTNGEVALYVNWSAKGYRLPTEAEWEKAARGGLSGQRFPWGNVIIENLANYAGNTTGIFYDLGPSGPNALFDTLPYPFTSPVGYFAANGYGLYDMAGNVYAWCWDWYGTPYGQPTTTNPTGPTTGSLRVRRSGAWTSNAEYLRCAARFAEPPSSSVYNDYACGFRCVCGL